MGGEEVEVHQLVKKYGIDRYPNVIGWSNRVRKKIVRGRKTDVDCIRIYVSKKVPRELLRKDEVIPEEVDGIPTDVVELGKLVKMDVYTSRYRPVPCGVSTGRADTYSAGTIGWWIATEDMELYMVSCNHVWANENRGKQNDPLLQPSLIDGGDPEKDVFAYLRDYIPLLTDQNNLVDIAVADMSDMYNKYTAIMELGGVSCRNDPVEDMEVVKVGRTTGVTRGRVIDDSATVRIEYSIGTITFTDVFIVSGENIVAPGDSGSPVLDVKNGFLGILIGGSEDGRNYVACKSRNIELQLSSRWGCKVHTLVAMSPPPFKVERIVVEKVVYPPYTDVINAVLGGLLVMFSIPMVFSVTASIARMISVFGR